MICVLWVILKDGYEVDYMVVTEKETRLQLVYIKNSSIDIVQSNLFRLHSKLISPPL